MLNKHPLTPVAAPATKASLMERFSIFGRRSVRTEINNVICELRACSLKQAKDQKVLKASEVAEVERRFS